MLVFGTTEFQAQGLDSRESKKQPFDLITGKEEREAYFSFALGSLADTPSHPGVDRGLVLSKTPTDAGESTIASPGE